MQKTALFEAIGKASGYAVAALLKHRAAFLPRENGVRPLHSAVSQGRSFVTRLLVEYLERSSHTDALQEINARNKFGKTALIDAADRNRNHIFQFLLDHKADHKIRDNSENSALHYVAWRNHHETAKVLLGAWKKEDPLTRQALLAHKNGNGNTGLQEALNRRSFPIVQMLLDAGAKITPIKHRDSFIRVDRQTDIKEIHRFITAFEGHDNELLEFLNHRNGTDVPPFYTTQLSTTV